MRIRIFIFSVLLSLTAIPSCHALDLEKLSEKDRQTVDSILAKTESKLTAIKTRGSNPNRLELDDFKSGLSRKEKIFIRKILRLRPADLGASTPAQPHEKVNAVYKEIKDQPVFQNGKPFDFLPPLVSLPTYEKYDAMMRAMEKNLGKRFYIESGHRSRGYHLYNFLKYLREHQYSLLETGKLNALPGYSEHNLFVYHAIDLINAEGINGEPKVEDYENLPEHQWMLKHAKDYGFTLSYPRGNPRGISFEPWHWRHTESND